MANTGEVLRRLAADEQLARMTSLRLPLLVPNERGLHQALEATALLAPQAAKEIAIFTAASDAFCLKNTNCTVQESLRRLGPVCKEALSKGLTVRGYVSTAIACPYDGPVSGDRVGEVASELLHMGCYEVSLGDTTGVGHVGSVTRMLESVLARIDASRLAVHFHDTYGQALANILAAVNVSPIQLPPLLL